MEERKAQSDPTPVEYEDDTESVASVSIKTRELYPWNWNIEMPRIEVTIPGWVILLGAVLFFRGPSTC